MMSPFIAGLVTLGVPLALLGLLFLRRNVPVLVFYLVALAVGLGYLTSTGAVDDIGGSALEKAGMVAETATTPAAPEPAAAPAPPAPAAEPAPASAPAPAATDPAAAPAQ